MPLKGDRTAVQDVAARPPIVARFPCADQRRVGHMCRELSLFLSPLKHEKTPVALLSISLSLPPSSLIALVGILYPRYRGPPVMAHSSIYDRFPPVANGWRTIHPISDTISPLLTEEEEPPT
jgi:hypothetical protein